MNSRTILFSLMAIASLALTSCGDDGLKWEPFLEFNESIYLVYNNLEQSDYNAAVHVEQTVFNTHNNETSTNSYDDTFDTTNEATLLLPTLNLYAGYIDTIKDKIIITYRITIETESGETRTDILRIVFDTLFYEEGIYFNGEEREYDGFVNDKSNSTQRHRYLFVKERKNQPL